MMRQTERTKRHSHARALQLNVFVESHIEQAEHVQRKKISDSVGAALADFSFSQLCSTANRTN